MKPLRRGDAEAQRRVEVRTLSPMFLFSLRLCGFAPLRHAFLSLAKERP